MIAQRSLHPFALSTEAAFTDNGLWLITANFSFHKTAGGSVRALLNKARLAMMAALTRQALLGWGLGAGTVLVRLKSGGHQTDFLLRRQTLTSNLRHLCALRRRRRGSLSRDALLFRRTGARYPAAARALS